MLTRKQQDKLEKLIKTYGKVEREIGEEFGDYYDDYNNEAEKRSIRALKRIWVYLDSLRKRAKKA